MRPPASSVLDRYPAPLRGAAEPFGGGFSGATVWRVATEVGVLCLRAGVAGDDVASVCERHRWMRLARDAGLRFVPAVLATSTGETVVEHAGRCWELMEWMPGRADFRDSPSPQRLRTAARALASVHLAWEGIGRVGPCPAVQRRLDASAGEPPPRATTYQKYDELAATVAVLLPEVPTLLRDAPAGCRLQPCLRDVWHDHLLFTGCELTGLIDYANAGIDSVAVDLARMLGSLVGDDDVGWLRGLKAYREVRPLTDEEERLALVLDRTGVIIALANWHRWLATGARNGIDPRRARQRVDELLHRVRSW